MSLKNLRTGCLLPLILSLTACFEPPFNDFNTPDPNMKSSASMSMLGTATGALIGSTIPGLGVGATAGGVVSLYRDSKSHIVKQLSRQDIDFIEYGDTMTLIVPTDHYFVFRSAQLNDICYEGLNNIVKLLKLYPKSTIYVAAFTDNIGKLEQKRSLSQAQAESMLTFLWANNIPAKQLRAEGHADHYPIGNNALIRGSAFNRRIEIQWTGVPESANQNQALQGNMK